MKAQSLCRFVCAFFPFLSQLWEVNSTLVRRPKYLLPYWNYSPKLTGIYVKIRKTLDLHLITFTLTRPEWHAGDSCQPPWPSCKIRGFYTWGFIWGCKWNMKPTLEKKAISCDRISFCTTGSVKLCGHEAWKVQQREGLSTGYMPLWTPRKGRVPLWRCGQGLDSSPNLPRAETFPGMVWEWGQSRWELEWNRIGCGRDRR